MSDIKTQTLKGFRDFLSKEALKRQYLIDKMTDVFKCYGYDPLQTPALEYAEVLMGKYGAEADKLLYLFQDNGGRDVGLRYDQTVPLARVANQYQDLPKPFKRYQIQNVWRAENTQKGRYREFLQCDADIIGDNNKPIADAEILSLFWNIYKNIGFKDLKIVVNSRPVLRKLLSKVLDKEPNMEEFLMVVRAIDKLDKIGEIGVTEELISKGLSITQVKQLFSLVDEWKNSDFTNPEEFYPDKDLAYSLQMAVNNYQIPREAIEFNPTLARGLDYYTGIIFEAVDPSFKSSLGGGGRYDYLIGQFTGNDLSAVGFAVGFDRTLEVAEELGLIPQLSTETKVLVAIVDEGNAFPAALNMVTTFRESGINAEIYLNPQDKLEKQFRYVTQKGIPYVVVVGPEEAEKKLFTLKYWDKKEAEENLSLDELVEKLRQ